MKNGFFIGDKFYMEKICQYINCGLPFIVNPRNINKANKYCSRNCYYLAKKGTDNATQTQKHNRHIKIRIDGKRIYEHRYIYEKNVRPLRPGEIVHHLDQNKHNNRVGNLEALENQEKHLHEHNYFRKSNVNKPENEMIEDFKEYGF